MPAYPDNPFEMGLVDQPGVNSGACTLMDLTAQGAYQDADDLWNYSVVADIVSGVTEVYPGTEL